MSIRLEIRDQSRAVLSETDEANTHFTDADLNEYIDQSQTIMATMIEYPRRITGVQVTDGTARYALPTDNLLVIAVYFGNIDVQGDVRPLQIITTETLTSQAPGWLDATISSKGRPIYAVVVDRATLLLHPRPDTEQSVPGKKYHIDYVYVPAALASDSSSPDLPLPFHDLMQFYVAHMAYLQLQLPEMATKMLATFADKVKVLRSTVVKETKQNLGWEWAVRGNYGLNFGGISFT